MNIQNTQKLIYQLPLKEKLNYEFNSIPQPLTSISNPKNNPILETLPNTPNSYLLTATNQPTVNFGNLTQKIQETEALMPIKPFLYASSIAF